MKTIGLKIKMRIKEEGESKYGSQWKMAKALSEKFKCTPVAILQNIHIEKDTRLSSIERLAEDLGLELVLRPRASKG